MQNAPSIEEPIDVSRPVGRELPRWRRLISTVAVVLVVPAAAACVLMLVQVVIDVASRNLFDHPVVGTLDMTSDWWMVTAVFLGLGWAQRRNEHVRATMITEAMPESWQRFAEIGAVVLLGLLGLAMAYSGWVAALDSYDVRESATSIRDLPLWPFRFLVPVGCVGLALQCVGTIYDIATASKREDHEGELI